MAAKIKPQPTRRPVRHLGAEERRPPTNVPPISPMDVTDRDPDESFVRFALRYIKEVASEDQTFFGFLAGFVAFWVGGSLLTVAYLTYAGGFTGFASGLFLALFVIPGLCAPLFIPAYGRLWIPFRVISAQGRADTWIHPQWRRILGYAYTWRINGALGIIMNDDKTPFIGRQTRPLVSDSAIYVDLDVTDLRHIASTPGISWKSLDPGLWLAAFGIVSFMLLVLLNPAPVAPPV